MPRRQACVYSDARAAASALEAMRSADGCILRDSVPLPRVSTRCVALSLAAFKGTLATFRRVAADPESELPEVDWSIVVYGADGKIKLANME